jgi:archaellum component FlaC
MAESILDELTRLEATAEVIKGLMERVSELEDQFKEYSDKAAGTMYAVSWADTLPDRLDKIEETAKPIKEGTGALTDKLKEAVEKQESTLESMSGRVEELEKKVGTAS